MMKIFITGATGFIGGRLVSLLEKDMSEIRVLSRKLHPVYETVICDLERESIPLSALESIDTVFHLAGFAHDLRKATKVEYLYRKVNVDATVKLAELAVASGVKQFVFVSSVKAGGSVLDRGCVNESDQGDPEGIYGETKREAELRLLEIGRQSGMHVSIVRPSLVYGPNAKGNLSLMLSGIEKGWFPPLPETKNRRSMIHVDDLVRALLLVANDGRANGEIFIATDGELYSSREIYETMCGLLNKQIPQWSVPKFLFDIAALMSANVRYKVNKLLGDECYTSEKLQLIGFKAQKSLSAMNETSF
jgi:nucleoside-diphosphate-sugar epimerase